jgi:hypothetical protein
MFADDTTIYITGGNLKFLTKKINEDLKYVAQWFDDNSLSLNVEKSNHIIFKPSNRKPDWSGKIKVSNEEIMRVSHTKFLGINIDEKLNWNEHVQSLLLKLSSGIYSLNMTKNILSTSSKRLLYFANIRSHLNYAICVWGPMTTASNLKNYRYNKIKLSVHCLSLIRE